MNTQDDNRLQTKRQTRHISTKNKMERSTASSRLSFHKTEPMCPTSVNVGGGGGGGGGDDDDDEEVLKHKLVVYRR
jgi:hypothetical protein